MATLLKVPWILAVTIAMHISHTSPATNPKAAVKQPSPASHSGRILDFIVNFCLTSIKTTVWIIGIAETTVTSMPFILTSLDVARSPNIERVTNVNLHPIVPLSVVGGFLILFGTAIRVVCYRALQDLHTFSLRIAKDHKLVTTGPYSIVRHPSYTGAITVYVGIICWYFSPGSIIVEAGGKLGKIISASCIAIILRVIYAIIERVGEEDEMLKVAFGEEWDGWAKTVPYALVPGFFEQQGVWIGEGFNNSPVISRGVIV